MTVRLLNVREVGEILGLKPARVYELTRERRIPFVLLGDRQYRWSATAIERFIESGGNQDQTTREVQAYD